MAGYSLVYLAKFGEISMSRPSIFGRRSEQKKLHSLLHSKEAEFLAVYGRRRVGKTFLIREFFSRKGKYFEISGEKDAPLNQQLKNFAKSFSECFLDHILIQTPSDWRAAFDLVTKEAQKIPKSKKFIFFIDEVPWFSSRKSGFIQALDYYWNHYWSKQKNFLLVTCGSAASWMIENLINAKGGLYNRVTQTILLKPFTLKETSEFLQGRKIQYNAKQLCEIYMVMGGIPHYLKLLSRGKSPTQNISEICFQKSGALYQEYERLFASLFNHSQDHDAIAKAIAHSAKGIAREELIRKTNIPSGGTLNKRLNELRAAGFIQDYTPYPNVKKSRYFRIVDEYLLFYLRWILPLQNSGIEVNKSYWKTKAGTPAVSAWKGYAFEMICLKHIDEILAAMGLEGIHSEMGTWRYCPKGRKDEGIQIDLFLDRSDGILTLFEIKYSQKKFAIDRAYAKTLMHRIDIVEKYFPSKNKPSLAMITLNGVKSSAWADELIDEEILFEDLINS